jgi:nucleotide-binding universal stress UspA family protein
MASISPMHAIAYSPAENPLTTKTTIETYYKGMKDHYDLMLSKALENAKKIENLDIPAKLVEGRPADEIVETAKEGNFDLIVMGSRGLGGIKEFFLGSVSDRVADEAECPVLIVK